MNQYNNPDPNGFSIFILVGGLGTRLSQVVSDVPKPMADIEGKPFITYQIEEIQKSFPDNNIYLLTHHLSEVIEDYFKEAPLIHIIKEPTRLGTGGAIKHALELSKSGQCLVLNGDTYTQVNLSKFVLGCEKEVSLVATFQENCDRYGTLKIREKEVVGFVEKAVGITNDYINSGIYFFKNTGFFDTIEAVEFSLEKALESYIDAGQSLGCFPYEGPFIDIGIPEDYEKMKRFIRTKT